MKSAHLFEQPRASRLMLAVRRALSSALPMSGTAQRDPRSPRSPSPQARSDEGLLSTLDAAGAASGEETITPDPFLDQVARVPSRVASPADASFLDSMPGPGETLGRFTILHELGRGGMGVVYAAEDRALGREVALKVLPPSGEERRRRFLREARSAAGLTHPGIAAIYDAGEANGRVFIAMELVHGTTLRAVLEARPKEDPGLPLPEVRRVAREIARALAKAHGHGVIHRDLKPENVMIDAHDEGRVKLLDFGLAKRCDASLTTESGVLTTEEGRVLGTPSYMSPEQAKGRPVDARSDVFTFGVMLYELCTGVRPFPGNTAVEVFIALDRDEPAPPSQKNPGVGAELEAIVLRCLQKDPARRYADARALLADLAQLEDASISGSTRSTRSTGAARSSGGVDSPRGYRWQVSAAGVALLSFVGIWAARGSSMHSVLGPQPVPMTALPVPRSSVPAAVVAYREGLAAFREGGDWGNRFRRALELDPNLASAHVQVAALGMFGAHEEARAHYRTAEALAASLDDRNRSLLAAMEPVVRRQPSDWAESKRRLAAMIERYPGDAQLWYLLAVGAANFDDFEDAVCKLETALTIDPGFTRAWVYMSIALSYLGRFDESRVVMDRCLQENPGADACRMRLASQQGYEGSCVAMEATARQYIAQSAQPKYGYAALAGALAGQGKPSPTIREALRQAEASLPAGHEADECRGEVNRMAGLLSIYEGDFDAAERYARQQIADAAASKTQAEHGEPAEMLAFILDETGRSAEAAQVALEFLDKRDAWEPNPSAEDIALAHDVTPAMLRLAVRGGRLTAAELAARRDPWARAWNAKVTPISRNFLWMYAHAAIVDTPEDARAALAAQPAYGALPPFRPETLVDVDVGRTYLLAGRVEEAIPWLTHATETCSVLSFPFAHVQAEVLLGQAREAQGDKASACARYNGVVQRWGSAKPRSVTAERAAMRAAALGCST